MTSLVRGKTTGVDGLGLRMKRDTGPVSPDV